MSGIGSNSDSIGNPTTTTLASNGSVISPDATSSPSTVHPSASTATVSPSKWSRPVMVSVAVESYLSPESTNHASSASMSWSNFGCITST